MLILYLFLVLITISEHFTPSNGILYNYVTCGSVIKLLNTYHSVRLHSHEVQYGSGSGQQSVTAIEEMDDINSHWVIKGIKDNYCKRGEPVKCGTTVRFEHLITKRNLHSHLFSAPLSHGQEVSAFGKEGEGDSGDNWTVTCSSDDAWRRDSEIKLKHVDTNMFLGISGQTFGHPIPGQMEVYAIPNSDSSTGWKVSEGIFIKPSELQHSTSHTESPPHEHTEF